MGILYKFQKNCSILNSFISWTILFHSLFITQKNCHINRIIFYVHRKVTTWYNVIFFCSYFFCWVVHSLRFIHVMIYVSLFSLIAFDRILQLNKTLHLKLFEFSSNILHCKDIQLKYVCVLKVVTGLFIFQL